MAYKHLFAVAKMHVNSTIEIKQTIGDFLINDEIFRESLDFMIRNFSYELRQQTTRDRLARELSVYVKRVTQ